MWGTEGVGRGVLGMRGTGDVGYWGCGVLGMRGTGDVGYLGS